MKITDLREIFRISEKIKVTQWSEPDIFIQMQKLDSGPPKPVQQNRRKVFEISEFDCGCKLFTIHAASRYVTGYSMGTYRTRAMNLCAEHGYVSDNRVDADIPEHADIYNYKDGIIV